MLMVLIGWALMSYLFLSNSRLHKENDRLHSNIVSLNNTIQDEAVAYQASLQTLQLSNDSLVKELAKKATKKTKEIVYVKSTATIRDTILLPADRIEVVKPVDTVLTDGEWYRLHIAIDTIYRLSADIIAKSELTYQVTTEKVIPEPKRWWIQRLFQRKVKVGKVRLFERSPYIEHDDVRYFDIIH